MKAHGTMVPGKILNIDGASSVAPAPVRSRVARSATSIAALLGAVLVPVVAGAQQVDRNQVLQDFNRLNPWAAARILDRTDAPPGGIALDAELIRALCARGASDGNWSMLARYDDARGVCATVPAPAQAAAQPAPAPVAQPAASRPAQAAQPGATPVAPSPGTPAPAPATPTTPVEAAPAAAGATTPVWTAVPEVPLQTTTARRDVGQNLVGPVVVVAGETAGAGAGAAVGGTLGFFGSLALFAAGALRRRNRGSRPLAPTPPTPPTPPPARDPEDRTADPVADRRAQERYERELATHERDQRDYTRRYEEYRDELSDYRSDRSVVRSGVNLALSPLKAAGVSVLCAVLGGMAGCSYVAFQAEDIKEGVSQGLVDAARDRHERNYGMDPGTPPAGAPEAPKVVPTGTPGGR